MQSGLHIIKAKLSRTVLFSSFVLPYSFFCLLLILSFTTTSAILFATSSASALEPTASSSGTPISSGLDLELSIEPVLQVIIPSDTLVLNLTPNPDPNTPVFTNKIMTVSVATNNPTGYSLMLNANSTNLTNTVADNEGNYALLPTLTDLEGGYSVESFTTNTWGYRYYSTILNNEATTTELGNYNAFFTSSELLSSKTPTNLDQTELDFAAKVDITQPAGTYELVLDFTAITNVIPGVVTINYDPNGADNPEAMAKQQFDVISPENLTPNAYTKENYVFIGWNTAKDGSGTHYDNNQLYTIPEGTTETSNIDLTLYAQWAPPYMQNVMASMCTTTPMKVADSRDNTIYTIQRLDDGNCWMMGNLSLDGGRTLTPEDTNIAVNFDLPENVSAAIHTRSEPEIISVKGEDIYGNKYGNLYNYCAVSGGTICINISKTNAVYDICPKGWRLPAGGASGDFQVLTTTYDIDSSNKGAIILQQSLGFPLAGYFRNDAPADQGIGAGYWSSGYYNDTAMQHMRFTDSSVYSQFGSDRAYGLSVRCILK